MRSQNPLISVVIPSFNEEKSIRFILSDLKKQSMKSFEVILVDGNSDDRTVEIAKSYATIKIVKKRSVGYQRNIGGKMSKGKFIYFIDSDTRINKNFIEDTLKIMVKRQLQIACPFYIFDSKSLFVKLTGYTLSLCFILLQKILPSGAGPCIIVERKIFLKEKGFDGSLNFQDMEYIRRIGKKYRFGILPRKVRTSDRRFLNDGIIKTISNYALLSILFTFGMFKFSNKINYKMNYKK